MSMYVCKEFRVKGEEERIACCYFKSKNAAIRNAKMITRMENGYSLCKWCEVWEIPGPDWLGYYDSTLSYEHEKSRISRGHSNWKFISIHYRKEDRL